MNTNIAIDNLVRCETVDQETFAKLCKKHSRRLYPHHEIYEQYCSLQEYIECPPEQLFAYLSQTESLLEWTYSLRNMATTNTPGLVMFGDKIGGPTKCYCRTESDAEALTVDYHCAWDQSEELWMIYYMRIIPAQEILNKPGSIVTWTNCGHPYYKNNPYPELAPEQRQIWVGDGWPFFKAGHALELENLKKICEYRYKEGINVSDFSY